MSSTPDSLVGDSSRRSWLKHLGGLLTGGLLLGRSRPAAAAMPEAASPEGLTPFLSEIMLVSFNFAPRGWALCNGQLLPINQNQALFSLLGTTYGGNGQTNFALPDLRGRVLAPIGSNGTATMALGERGGTESHTLLASQIPPHMHGMKCSTDLGTTPLSGTSSTVHHYLADNGGGAAQYGSTANTELASFTTAVPLVNVSSSMGGGQPHENRQPYLCLNYVIALQGIFPSAS
ncbi:phage tail protein [Hymenobacter canadensis]|uniref:Tail fiber protein n=1 Tax=Hymenobacter canadensis TaxID=2999067 RepID=A0ABY7LL07_9BACT|nr:tail fiber protein [Hymenobacter canadensis]WBA41133.1 tail fiber protein [Hymenobacter canadensis]